MEKRVEWIQGCIAEGIFEPVLDEMKCAFCPEEIKKRCLEG